MTKKDTPGGDKTIGAVETAFDIIEIVAERGEVDPGELAETLDYSRSTIHYYLTTLEKHRFLTRGENGYRIGFRFLHYGNVAIRNHELTGVVEPEVESLARETEMTALFAIQQQGRSVFLHQSSPGDTADTEHYLGAERRLHRTPFGKALLAHLPEGALDAIVEEHGVSLSDSESTPDREILSEELQAIREQGFAHGTVAGEEGVRSIAVPIVRNRDEVLVGAIGIVGRDEAIADPGAHIKAQRFAENPVTIVKRHAQILRNKVT